MLKIKEGVYQPKPDWVETKSGGGISEDTSESETTTWYGATGDTEHITS